MNILFRISLRYLTSRSFFSFISFSVILSIIALIISVASLIIITSFSSGFSNLVNSKLSDLDGHLRIHSYIDKTIEISEFNRISNKIKNYSLAPFIENNVIINNNKKNVIFNLYGISKYSLKEIFNLDKYSLNKNYFENDNSIIVGKKIANDLDISLNDTLILTNINNLFLKGKIFAKKFIVSDIFETHFPEYDKQLAFIKFKTAQEFFDIENKCNGFILNVKDPLHINKDIDLLDRVLDNEPYYMISWKERHKLLLEWLLIYDAPIKIVMIFISVIAIINIGSSLWLIFIDKIKNYAIMKAYGLSKRKISLIILIQGLYIGIIGVVLGALFSFFILYFENQYHFIKIPDDIYFTNYLPVSIELYNFIFFPMIALLAILILSIIPAYYSSKKDLFEKLKYE